MIRKLSLQNKNLNLVTALIEHLLSFQIFDLLPVRTAPTVSDELLDVEENCLYGYMGFERDAYMIFKVIISQHFIKTH